LTVHSEKSYSNQKALKIYLESNVIKNAKKLKGRFAPISELVESIQKTLTIRAIFDLKDQLKDFFLIIVKNYTKQLKLRFFLAIRLAFQSSDFLVALSKDFALKNDLKLIQYSIFPKNPRISLLSMKEIRKIEDYAKSIKILQDFRIKFRKTLEKIKNKVENE
jgi:hypothetical protein